jgi:hypothetical protein
MNIIKIVFKAANIGCITSDGVVFQAWRQPDQWTSTRIGGVFGTYDAAYDALLSACMELAGSSPSSAPSAAPPSARIRGSSAGW